MAYLNYAREYHEAAEELFQRKRHLSRVQNALYFHVVEVLLKAYLRAHNEIPPRDHDIGKLYRECRKLGLKIGSDDEFGLENIVNLLKAGNRDMAFRYFSLESSSEPDLAWTREVVGQLMPVVAAFVESRKSARSPGGIKKMIMTFGKPGPKNPVQ